MNTATTTRMITHTTMPTDPRLLTLTQWLSPSYPLGSFAYSHGLEAAIRWGWIEDEARLLEWLSGVITEGSGFSDATLILQAYRADNIDEINAIARAYAPSSERLREAERQGSAFARVTRDVWELDLPDLLLPVALGRAAQLVTLDPEAVSALYLHAFASNLIQAAQRLMPLGQTAGQRILHQLTPVCTETAQRAANHPLDEIYSNAFLSDIASMHHETLEPRLFQS